jgi:hypothetical protein
MPVNCFSIENLRRLHEFYGGGLMIEIADERCRRLVGPASFSRFDRLWLVVTMGRVLIGIISAAKHQLRPGTGSRTSPRSWPVG